MKQITKRIMMALMLFFVCGTLSAQLVYVVDALRGDSTALYPFDSEWRSDKFVHIDPAIGKIVNGTRVSIAAEDTIIKPVLIRSGKPDNEPEAIVVAVTYKDKKYFIESKDLVLSSKSNPEGTVDFINKEYNYHTYWGHWYFSYTPYILILILLVATIIFGILARRASWIALFVPILLLGAIAVEVFGVKTLGTDMLWWIDPEQNSMGMILVRLILFAAAAVMQIFSIRLFKNAVGGELSFKGPLIGIVVGAIIFILSFIVAMIWNKSAETIVNTGLILMGVSILIGVLVTAIKNIREIGFIAGIALAIFAFIYGIGLIVLLAMLVIGIITAFMEMIVTIGGGILVLIIMSKIVPSREYTRSDGTRVEVYEDFHV